jgi:hypothetical protein
MFIFLRFWVLSDPLPGFVAVIGYVNIVVSQAYNSGDSERKQGGFHGRITSDSNSPTSNESEAEKVAFKTPSLCNVVMM